MISHTRQGVRFVTGIALLRLGILYHTRDRGYELLQPLGSASCEITHKTWGTICYGHWVLRLVITHTRQGGTICYGHWVLRFVISHTRQGYDFLRALGSASCDITHETGFSICYGHWVLGLVMAHTRQGGPSCYGHWVLRLVISHTRQGHELLRALGSASCDIAQ